MRILIRLALKLGHTVNQAVWAKAKKIKNKKNQVLYQQGQGAGKVWPASTQSPNTTKPDGALSSLQPVAEFSPRWLLRWSEKVSHLLYII